MLLKCGKFLECLRTYVFLRKVLLYGVGWLGDWLVGWLVGWWLGGWLVGWLGGWLVGWLVGGSVGRSVGCLVSVSKVRHTVTKLRFNENSFSGPFSEYQYQYQYQYQWSSAEIKRLVCEVNHSSLYGTEFKNECSYTSTPPMCLHGVNTESFTFTLQQFSSVVVLARTHWQTL